MPVRYKENMNILYTPKDPNFYEVEILDKPRIVINKLKKDNRFFLQSSKIEEGYLRIKSEDFFPLKEDSMYIDDLTIITYDERNVPVLSFKTSNGYISSFDKDENIYTIECDWIEEYLL